MKWKKFLVVSQQHPAIAHDLCWRGNPVPSGGQLKEFVRTKVGFIAFRPFESLDFQSRGSSTEEPLPGKYRYASIASYSAIEWLLVFHIELEKSGTRLRYVNSGYSPGRIQDHMDEIRQWHHRCEAFKGRQIIWERAVKRTVKGSSNTGLTEMNLEIYQFPPRWGFISMPSAKPVTLTAEMLRDREASRAYVHGSEFPPIIPARC